MTGLDDIEYGVLMVTNVLLLGVGGIVGILGVVDGMD